MAQSFDFTSSANNQRNQKEVIIRKQASNNNLSPQSQGSKVIQLQHHISHESTTAEPHFVRQSPSNVSQKPNLASMIRNEGLLAEEGLEDLYFY